MQLTLRRGAAVLMLLTLVSAAVAQPYPSRSIRMIIPAGPGGGVDTVARVVGQALSTALGQPVVMDNRPGAGTMLASELTAKAPPDGYTLLMVTNSNTINSRPHVKSKKLNALAITSHKRSPLYPDLPTVSESGLPGYQADAWYGILAPARTPPEIVTRLNREVVAILKTGDAKDKLLSQGAEVFGGTPEQFVTVMSNDIRKWGKVTAGLKLQMN